MKKIFPGALLFVLIVNACAQPDRNVVSPEVIRLNQIGFYPDAEKIAVVVTRQEADFFVCTPDQKQKLFTGKLGAERSSPYGGQSTRLADFTAFNKTGTFVFMVPDLGYSQPFTIAGDVYNGVAIGTMKAFYFMRVSDPLPETYAGKWARAKGNADDHVLVHPSAASPLRPAGTVLSAPGGWYDAGDYNKYIVNSGITMGTLLSLCEDFSDRVAHVTLNIPESNDAVPDVLNEIVYNLRWMLAMQDPEDGGVYHKLTHAAFDGMVMPGVTTKERYVVQKGTAATLDFVAVMAQAARVLARYEKEFPGLATACLQAAKRGWAWAVIHPDVVYDQGAINNAFDPDISTGAYGDKSFNDEWLWASAEMYCTTKDEHYYPGEKLFSDTVTVLPAWPNVGLLAFYTLAKSGDTMTAAGKKDLPAVRDRVIRFANKLLAAAATSPYGTSMGSRRNDFVWGSNSVAANQGIALIQAYQLTGKKEYLRGAMANLDYLLGRNGTGYSFVTGYGVRTPLYPHHRPSQADGIAEPVPGMLVGGPNPGRQDNCRYPSDVADECYVDDVKSYASNEIAINWNAPMVYLANAIEAINRKK